MTAAVMATIAITVKIPRSCTWRWGRMLVIQLDRRRPGPTRRRAALTGQVVDTSGRLLKPECTRSPALAKCPQEGGDRALAGGMPHEPDPPGHTRELAQPAADLDAVLGQEDLPQARLVHAGGQAYRGELGQPAALLGDQGPAQLGEPLLEPGADGLVAGPR